MTVLTGTIQFRQGTAAQWVAENPVLLHGEPGYETDTGKEKRGDDVTPWNALAYLPSVQTGLVSGGAITIGIYGGAGLNNDVRIAAAAWYIVGSGGFSTVIDTDFLDVALSSAGNQRYVGFYGNALSAIVKVEGAEAALASLPATPPNTAVIGYILVGDAVIGSTPPDLSGYLLKADKATPAEVVTGTEDAKYITPLGLKGAKDASGGYLGKTLEKINFWNAARSFMSFIVNAATNVRTYTFPDKDITVAGLDDFYSRFFSGKYISALGVSSLNAGAGFNGSIFTVTILVAKTGIFTGLRISLAVGAASSNIRLGLYDDSGGYPNALLEDSGNVSSATSGEKTFAFSSPRTLVAGVYHLGFQTSSASVSIRNWSSVVNILPRTSGSNPVAAYRLVQAFGAYPNPFTAGATERNNGDSIPMVELLCQ